MMIIDHYRTVLDLPVQSIVPTTSAVSANRTEMLGAGQRMIGRIFRRITRVRIGRVLMIEWRGVANGTVCAHLTKCGWVRCVVDAVCRD